VSSGLFPSGFPTKILYVFRRSVKRTTFHDTVLSGTGVSIIEDRHLDISDVTVLISINVTSYFVQVL